MADDPLRLLILGNVSAERQAIVASLQTLFNVDVVERVDDALEALRHGKYSAVLTDVGAFLPLERELVGEKAALVLNTIGEGVIIVDADGRCAWSNKRMRSFAPEVIEKVKQICLQARQIFCRQLESNAPDTPPHSRKFTCQFGDRYYELITSPVSDERSSVGQVVAVVWDATSGRQLQQKLDAIDAAGRELARLESDAITRLKPNERLQLLQDKIIRYSKDLMRFDHFTVRLLEKRTNKLEVVISEGLPTEALQIDLYAQPEGNGISGYVAATGRSYICHDTEKDSRYVQGLDHCKSSLTVPLKLYDKVIGIYNIESDSIGTFNEDDRQFAEIFARYVAIALNILDLLVVERYTTTGQLADSVVQEMAQPLNDIVTEAQTLMEEYIGDDTMRGRLHRIVDYVEAIRSAARDVAAGPQAVLGSHGPDAEPEHRRLKAKRVLVADDEPNIRATLCDVLRKHGCECDMCKDGYEAINLIESRDYDLIVSDIKMPYRNGYEIFAAAQRKRDDLPVILMTGFGYDPNHSIVRASQEGLASVLFKPFKVDQLLEDVFAALGVEPSEPSQSAD